MSRTSTDVVQWVLLTPEIQDKIFSFNNAGDAFRCSLVCKSWHPVALDHIWHHLHSLRPLFNYLAPISAPKESWDPFDFERSVTDDDRTRFSSISRRVNYLEIDSGLDRFPSKSAVFEFSQLRSETTGSTLPNLKGLRLWVVTDYDASGLAALFLHSRLEWLYLTEPHYGRHSEEIKAVLCEVTLRSPNLRKLLVNISVREVLAELMRLVLVQQSLVTLTVPEGTLTVPFLECLSRLPKLRSASYWNRPIDGTALSPPGTLPCNWRDDSVRFPSIRFLRLDAQPSVAGSFISTYPSFSKLMGLLIETVSHTDAKEIRRFLEIISDACGGLEILTLEQRYIARSAARDAITKDTLAPLVSLRALREFSLKHPWPIQMTDDELVDFLDSCPKFTVLYLNRRPRAPPSDLSLLPTLAIIHRLVPVQPKLEHLSMYFNGLNCRLVETSTGVINKPFEKLRSLNVGYTQINETSRIALYLRQLLPLDCKLTYDDKYHYEYHYGREEEEESLWEDVLNQLSLLKYAFRHYREQSRKFNEENVRLNEENVRLNEENVRLNEGNVRLKKAMKAAVIVLEAMCPSEDENHLGVTTIVETETETEHAA